MSKEGALAVATGTPAPQGAKNEHTTESPAAAIPAGTPTDEQRVQALIKKEVSLVKDREALKKKETEWQQKVEQAEKLLARDKEYDETKKTDKIKALKMLGWDDNDIFEALAESAPREKTPEELARAAAQDEIKKENDRRAAESKDAESKRNADLIKGLQVKISTVVDKNPDKYEFCKFNGKIAEDLIYSTIEEVVKSEGKLLTAEEAADLVEGYYEEQAKLMDGLKKRKPVAPAEPAQVEQVAEVKAQPQQAGKPKTLTNNVRPTATASAPKKETAEQKRARLEDALRQGVHPSQLR